MSLKCAAFGCYNRQTREKGSVNFYRFPFKNPDVLSEWIKVLKRGTWKPSANSKLCSLHFKDEDYLYHPKRLKDDAVPSIFNLPDELQGLLKKIRSYEFTLSPKNIKPKKILPPVEPIKIATYGSLSYSKSFQSIDPASDAILTLSSGSKCPATVTSVMPSYMLSVPQPSTKVILKTVPQVKAENASKYQPNLDIVKQEPPDNTIDEPLPSPENIPASQLLNGIVYSQNLNDTTALRNSFNQWIIPNNPDGISSSAAFTDISESSSTLYTCANTSEPSYKSLKFSMNSSPNSSEIKDGFSVFGEFVATKIRSFTEQNLQVEAQNCIMHMLFEMEMKLSTKVNMPVINNMPSLKTTSSTTATLPSNIVLISSNPRNSVAFNAMLKTDIQ